MDAQLLAGTTILRAAAFLANQAAPFLTVNGSPMFVSRDTISSLVGVNDEFASIIANPSPELFHIDGVASLHDTYEALNAQWTLCDTLCGPRPKPDFVGGVARSAFTNEEREKLRLSHISASPNSFPENMYYPFLICEVKGSDRPVDAAERQAMHSASIAVRALI
ncbi:hypothetical protein LTR86_011148 [Recurvomyces mirabilis]|nr:hypothetical protein LTR86_011148 [Recurvomyces mirabilis]